MALLPLGLTELVADIETLARFLTQSNHYNTAIVKPAAFLPHPTNLNTSVFRGDRSQRDLVQTWKDTSNGTRALKAVARVKAQHVRRSGLDVHSEKPPHAHANIEGWPWSDHDPELAKARQSEIAILIASEAELVLINLTP